MANPKLIDRQSLLDQKPFEHLRIGDNSILNTLEGRHPCPKCGKSRKFYCYSCYVPIKELEGKLPFVKLPIKIDIIKHKNEIDGKSTSGHAAILAPEDVKIYTYPDIPSYDNENVILIFPSQQAISINQLVQLEDYQDIVHYVNQPLDEVPEGHNRGTLMKKVHRSRIEEGFVINEVNLPITKAIFIDSTWNQSKGIYKDERLRKIPCVVIQNRISQFWRHQRGSPRWYLATIEAIHQFLVEVHLHLWGLNPLYKGIDKCFGEKSLSAIADLYSNNDEAYNGQYDNLLYFFQHMYDLIHAYYDHDNLHAYKRRLT